MTAVGDALIGAAECISGLGHSQKHMRGPNGEVCTIAAVGQAATSNSAMLEAVGRVGEAVYDCGYTSIVEWNNCTPTEEVILTLKRLGTELNEA